MVPIADIRITNSSSSGMCTLNLTNIRSKFFGRMKEDRCTSNGTLSPKSAPLIGPGRHGPIVAKLMNEEHSS